MVPSYDNSQSFDCELRLLRDYTVTQNHKLTYPGKFSSGEPVFGPSHHPGHELDSDAQIVVLVELDGPRGFA
jgi:hypothetical protein